MAFHDKFMSLGSGYALHSYDPQIPLKSKWAAFPKTLIRPCLEVDLLYLLIVNLILQKYDILSHTLLTVNSSLWAQLDSAQGQFSIHQVNNIYTNIL